VLCTYNIERAKLEIASKITPGRRAPTITSLEEDGWVAVSVMVLRKEVAVVMDRLTEAGACDILVTRIDNSRTS
jgi:ATP phosphoribosyltransferase